MQITVCHLFSCIAWPLPETEEQWSSDEAAVQPDIVALSPILNEV
jgi:hypothetical protein